jgi:hypothetical protein
MVPSTGPVSSKRVVPFGRAHSTPVAKSGYDRSPTRLRTNPRNHYSMRFLGGAEGEGFEPSSDPKARNGFRDRFEESICRGFPSRSPGRSPAEQSCSRMARRALADAGGHHSKRPQRARGDASQLRRDVVRETGPYSHSYSRVASEPITSRQLAHGRRLDFRRRFAVGGRDSASGAGAAERRAK